MLAECRHRSPPCILTIPLNRSLSFTLSSPIAQWTLRFCRSLHPLSQLIASGTWRFRSIASLTCLSRSLNELLGSGRSPHLRVQELCAEPANGSLERLHTTFAMHQALLLVRSKRIVMPSVAKNIFGDA
ncbi:hypothetical protein [Chlorogloeopsis sp. ULAP02]|uniref:hypothetical protein n=1 Tax=Chlorogloeopsis sp. ULAP02 TaxID=3107926 RepID=UPI00313561CE